MTGININNKILDTYVTDGRLGNDANLVMRKFDRWIQIEIEDFGIKMVVSNGRESLEREIIFPESLREYFLDEEFDVINMKRLFDLDDKEFRVWP